MIADLFPTCARLRKTGDVAGARVLLRDALRRGEVEDLERAGRSLAKDTEVPNATGVRVLGQCTTSWVPPVLTAVAWGRGMAIRVSDGDYDNILQELDRTEETDILVLLPWTQRLFTGDDAKAAIEGELAFWSAAWERRRGAKLIQVGYDWTGPGPAGVTLSGTLGGRVERVRAMNAALRARLPTGAAWIDLEQIAGEMGRNEFYDPRGYRWTKQPFSTPGLELLCRHLAAAVRAITTGPKKVLVLDLDNTLWGGVVGETGAMGVAIRETPDGESFRAFQQHCKGLSQRGVLLAVASKNNPADALEPFEKNPDMVLRRSDFAGFEATWEPKAHALARMAAELRLGLDSFVFFDDNPAEREHIRQALPEVEVVDVPEEPALYIRALESGLWFEAVTATAEDAARSAQYQAESARKSEESSFASLDDYLVSLEMRADVRAVDDDDLERVVQLLGKTNQFNLTTRRHGTEVVQGWMADPRAVLLTVRVADRFGDHGLVAVILGIPDADDGTTLVVDTWLMSCRVIGRSVEQLSWGAVLDRARGLAYRRIRGAFIPTAKNQQVATLYAEMGLSPVPSPVDGQTLFEGDVFTLPLPRTFVRCD